MFHPDTLNIEGSIKQTENLCDALVKLDTQTVFIYPNADAGGRRISEIVDSSANHPKIQSHENLSQIEYYSMMNISTLMLGNSSSGLRENPQFGLPFVNIGDRQKGRKDVGNVVNVSGETDEIIDVVNKLLNNDEYRNKLGKCNKVYGEGKAGEKIAEILSKL